MKYQIIEIMGKFVVGAIDYFKPIIQDSGFYVDNQGQSA